LSLPVLNILMSKKGIEDHGLAIEKITPVSWWMLESQADADGTYPIVKYLKALDIKVIGITRSNFLELSQVLPNVDFLILACPLTAQTKNLVNASLLAQMKHGSYLVNVARGEVCVEADVIAALQSGQLGGAFLDGFEVEPLRADSPLWSLPNVMLSAHTAGHFTGHSDNVAKIFIDNLARFVQGRELLNEVRANT